MQRDREKIGENKKAIEVCWTNSKEDKNSGNNQY